MVEVFIVVFLVRGVFFWKIGVLWWNILTILLTHVI